MIKYLTIFFSFLAFPGIILAESPDTINIGATLTLSGETAFWGDNARKGIELAIEEVNQNGGINGKKLGCLYEDFQLLDLKKAASAASKLINIDRVPVILTQWSEDTEVVAPIASRANVVVLTISAGAKGITRKNPLLFRIWPSDEFFVKAEVDEALRQNKKKATIIGAQTAYFQSLQQITADLWKERTGLEPNVHEVDPSTSDFRSIILKIKGERSDVIFLHIPIEREGVFLKQLRESGLNILKFGHQQSDNRIVLDTAGNAANDLIFPQYTPATKYFADAFRDRYHEEPGVPSEYSYDAVKILATVMREHGTATEQIQQGLLAIKDYAGASGNLTINKDRDREEKEVQLKIIKNGKSILLSEN